MCSQERMQRKNKPKCMPWCDVLLADMSLTCFCSGDQAVLCPLWYLLACWPKKNGVFHLCDVPSRAKMLVLKKRNISAILNLQDFKTSCVHQCSMNSNESSKPATEGHEPFASQRGGYGCTMSLSTRFFRASKQNGQSIDRNLSPSVVCLAKNAEV